MKEFDHPPTCRRPRIDRFKVARVVQRHQSGVISGLNSKLCIRLDQVERHNCVIPSMKMNMRDAKRG